MVRKHWWLGVGLLAVAGGWLLWPQVAHWLSFRWPARGGLPWGEADIVALGDSVTYGDGMPAGSAYPALLADLLARHVRNAGIVGDTALGGLARLERDALRYRPAVVLIGYGLNDSGLYGPLVPQTEPAYFREALAEMVRQVREAGAVPMLLSPPPVDAGRALENGLHPGAWGEYDRLVRQVAEDEAVALVDLAAAFGSDFGLLADGVHPTAEGQARIAAAVQAVLARLEGKGLPPLRGGGGRGRETVNLRGIWQKGWAVLRARWYLRKANRLGPRARVWGRPVVNNWGQMRFGARLRLVSTIATTELVTGSEGRLEIGEGVFINYGCSISANELVRIGDRCSIGTYVIIMDNDFHQVDPERRKERPLSAPVVLGENVWLGARVIVLKGVTIGHDSVVGAGSVVTRDVPPRCVAAGVPARVVRKQDEE